jgi:predicted RecA/RadA family phage recombinase
MNYQILLFYKLFVNDGRRISYGEARQIEDGDVVGFGDVEVRFRKSE